MGPLMKASDSEMYLHVLTNKFGFHHVRTFPYNSQVPAWFFQIMDDLLGVSR
jgi:hypothetical protein